jgi:hypothetical protein
MRLILSTGLVLALAGCGGGSQSADGVQGKVAEIASAKGSNSCDKNPDFAPIYADAVVKVCSSAHFDATGKDAGTVSYTTAATPATVIAWAKEQAAKSGLAARIETDKMFSAGEGTKRTMAMFVRPEGSGSNVTVNWGKAP